MSGSNLGRNVVCIDLRFWCFVSVIHAAAFDVMLEVSVSDSVVNKPRENIAYSAEIKSKCKFDSASSMKFFPRGAV